VNDIISEHFLSKEGYVIKKNLGGSNLMSPERDGGNQLGCKLNGKLTLINFENFEQSNGIRVELIKELDDSEVFEEKRR